MVILFLFFPEKTKFFITEYSSFSIFYLPLFPLLMCDFSFSTYNFNAEMQRTPRINLFLSAEKAERNKTQLNLGVLGIPAVSYYI